jgi:hypothetical protein
MACKGSIVETSSVAALAWLRWVIEGRIETARTRLSLKYGSVVLLCLVLGSPTQTGAPLLVGFWRRSSRGRRP